jgi:hypothetical protein
MVDNGLVLKEPQHERSGLEAGLDSGPDSGLTSGLDSELASELTAGQLTSEVPQPSSAPQARPTALPAQLGVLSIHFEGGRCRVACPFCYLGKRAGQAQGDLDIDLVVQLLQQLPYREVAVSLSEPIEPVLPALARIIATAQALRRPVAVTTTLAVAAQIEVAALAGISRLNLSVDPWKKGPSSAASVPPSASPGKLRVLHADADAESRPLASADPATPLHPEELLADLALVAARLPKAERVLIVSLSTQRFAEQLWDGLLAQLLTHPAVDRVALNALKPPPSWCDRVFWLRALQRLGPLLQQHLDRRLFLDCYVAARILGIGGCPARPDLSPSSSEEAAQGRLAFRGCVYQSRPDHIVDSASDLTARLQQFVPPAECPFPVS